MFGLGDQRLRLRRRSFAGSDLPSSPARLPARSCSSWLFSRGITRPAWHSFRTTTEPSGAISRFGGLGSNRYDLWRVGLIEFRRHPIQGIGVDNFLVPYLQQRRSDEEPVFPHSLAVDLLSETGLVGTVLFAAFLVAAVAGARRIPRGPDRELAGMLVVGAAVWLLHAQVDWLWEMPVLGIIGMGLVGAALGLVPRRACGSAGRSGRRRWALALALGVAGAVVVRGGSFWRRGLPSETCRRRARCGEPTRPAHSLSSISARAEPAERPARPRRRRDREPAASVRRGAQPLRTGARRSPDDWYANLELGIAASLAGPTSSPSRRSGVRLLSTRASRSSAASSETFSRVVASIPTPSIARSRTHPESRAPCYERGCGPRPRDGDRSGYPAKVSLAIEVHCQADETTGGEKHDESDHADSRRRPCGNVRVVGAGRREQLGDGHVREARHEGSESRQQAEEGAEADAVTRRSRAAGRFPSRVSISRSSPAAACCSSAWV